MSRNRITDILNIKYPILQGGMAWVSTGELALAVSEAGGLGIIAAGNAPADVLQYEIKKVKDNSDKPFGVNIMLLSPYVDEIIDLLLKEKVPVVTTGAGNPGKYMDRLKEGDTKVIPVVPSVALAKRLERQKVDALIAEGTEAGGHIGELTTMTLVPQIVDAVDIPVIAAGGVIDGRGLVAAFALGAEGVQIGTRFVCAKECEVHSNYKEAIIKAKDRDTVVSGRSTGHPVRSIKNKLNNKLQQLEKEGAGTEEIEELGSGKMALAAKDGDIEMGSVMAGQVASMVKEEKSASEIIEEIVQGAKEVQNNLKFKF